MKPEQQRIAISEVCGLTNVAPMIVKNVKHEGDDITVGIWSDDGWVPQYLNDLNAMHEAEKLLVRLQWVSYLRRLQTLCDESVTWPIHATASQRAEAFLRTIGKWEESK